MWTSEQQVRLPEDDRQYYVTVKDAGRTGFLLGPYTTQGEALENVNRGRKLALEANDRAWFYAYGTSSVAGDRQARTLFGK